RAILHWQDFSIAAGETTRFVQPSATSAALNRVLGGNPSAIYGTLSSNGQIFLINPNGILVGPSGVVDTGGFLASTLDISDENFLSGGDLRFKGTSDASVVNLGKISASSSDVILIARTVENHGTIEAPNGTAALAAGSEVLVKADGEERIFVEAGSAEGTSKATQAGLIRAAAAEIKAAGGNEYALAIKHTGVTRATGVTKRGGRIFLSAGGKGTVRHSGTITARKSDGNGGQVKVEAARIDLAPESKIDVSADPVSPVGNGGEVLIGGGYQGRDASIRNAEAVTAEEGSLILADAAAEGDGGRVILWSDDTTRFAGTISARGGSESGDGGFAEVSGKESLAMSGFADLSAANGAFGHLLLDPGSVVIQAGPSTNSGFDIFNDAWIANQLGLGSVTIATSNASTGNETITVNADVNIEWAQPTTLTLDAGSNIVFEVNTGSATGYTGPGRVGSSAYTEGAIITNTYSGANFDAIVMRANQGTVPVAGVIGISLRGATLSTLSGNIDLAGTASGGSQEGIVISHGSYLRSNGDGNILLNGQGGRSGLRMFFGVSGGPRAQIDVADGNLTIHGTAGDGVTNHAGIFLDGARFNSTGAGNIEIFGHGGSGAADANRRGAWIYSTQFALQSTGSLNIEGLANSGDSHGLYFQSGGITHSGSGSIRLAGQGAGANADIFSDMSVGGAAASGDITLVADRLEWTAGTIRSTGDLYVTPRTPSKSIGIAGGVRDVQLDAAFLNRIQDGFNSITIGADDGSGAISVGSYTFKDNVILRTPIGNGDIVLNGALATGSGSQAGTITLQAGRSILGNTGASVTTQGGDIVFNADRDESNGGNIQLVGTDVASHGGDIVMGGGADPLTTA
ncbi:MAG: filamentous hemagglutinin N-terminal domain-containing protein, partial [Verrucomicrobiaceae bacterium]|nr:filamentous hemagglutinin N-terminal domain-containing protein [Verrucomicrobiaceae bacterium]